MWQMLPKPLSTQPNALVPARGSARLVRGPAVTVLMQKLIAQAAAPAPRGRAGVSLAQPSGGKCMAISTNFYRMLWKFCLCLQWFVLLKCLTCLRRSSHSSTHGVVEPDHPLAYWEFLQGTTSDVQRGLNVLVSLLMAEFEKEEQALNFDTSAADLAAGCRQPPSSFCG